MLTIQLKVKRKRSFTNSMNNKWKCNSW